MLQVQFKAIAENQCNYCDRPSTFTFRVIYKDRLVSVSACEGHMHRAADSARDTEYREQQRKTR